MWLLLYNSIYSNGSLTYDKYLWYFAQMQFQSDLESCGAYNLLFLLNYLLKLFTLIIARNDVAYLLVQ